MKILKSRREFIISINEALSNDIQWGDSLLGRLINSTIRKKNINNNLNRIDGVLSELKLQFDLLSDIIKVSGSQDSYEKFYSIFWISVFTEDIREMREFIKSQDLPTLIKSTKSKINAVKNYIIEKEYQKNEQLREEFVDILENFLKFLEDLNRQSVSNKKSKSKENLSLAKSSEERKLPTKVGSEIEKKEVPSNKGNEIDKSRYEISVSNVEVDEIKREFDNNINEMLKEVHRLTAPYYEITGFEKFGLKDLANNIYGKAIEYKKNKDFNKLASIIIRLRKGELFKKRSDYKKAFDEELEKIKVKKGDNLTDEEIENIHKTVKDNIIKESNRFLLKYSEFILENTESEVSILDKFNEMIKDFEKKLEIENHNDLEESVKESEERKIPMDPVIEIIRIFNRAYRLHTPGSIPSGRSEGKVSVSVFNEYEYIGSGTGGTPDRPGSGPYRNIKIFDKWREGVMSLIKDPKYQEIFNQKTSFKIGKSDMRKNVNEKSKTQGGGKTLLTFITSMLNDSNLYKGEAQSKFISQYFNVDLPDSKFNSPGFNDIETNSKNSADVNEEFIFKSGSKKLSIGRIFQIENKDGKNNYFRVIGKKDNEYYLIFTLGYPFSKPEVDGLKVVNNESEIYLAKTKNDIFDDNFELEYRKIDQSGVSKNSEFDSEKFRWINSKVLYRGNKIYTGDFELIKQDHRDRLNMIKKYTVNGDYSYHFKK